MSYGITRVGIPPGHLMARKEAPSLLKFEWTPDEHKHIKVRDVLQLSKDDFFRRLTRVVAESPDGKIMIFVHGYNVEFPEASRDVAQFAGTVQLAIARQLDRLYRERDQRGMGAG